MVISIIIDTKEAFSHLTGLQEKIPKAAREGIEKWAKETAVALRKGYPRKVTGYLSSEKGTHAKKLDKDTWGIKMPSYVWPLEKGSRPHPLPHTWKTEMAARKYGMNFFKLKMLIAKKGTKPHPFTDRVLMAQFPRLKMITEEKINRTIAR